MQGYAPDARLFSDPLVEFSLRRGLFTEAREGSRTSSGDPWRPLRCFVLLSIVVSGLQKLLFKGQRIDEGPVSFFVCFGHGHGVREKSLDSVGMPHNMESSLCKEWIGMSWASLIVHFCVNSFTNNYPRRDVRRDADWHSRRLTVLICHFTV